MKFLIAILVFFFALGQLGRVELIGSQLVLQTNELAVGFIVIVLFLLNRKKVLSEIRSNDLTKPLAIWFLAIIISLIANIFRFTANQILISSLYVLRFFLFAGLYFVIKATFAESDKKYLTKGLGLGLLAVAGFGLVQYFVLPDVSFLKAVQWDDHYFRLVSTFLDPGFTGAVLVLLVVQLFLQTGWQNFKKNWSDGLILILTYLSLALTYSRASFLMFVSAFVVLAWIRKSWKIFLAAIVLVFMTIRFLPVDVRSEGTRLNRENSVWARIHNWQQSIEIWQKAPIFGHGFNTYRYTKEKFGLSTQIQTENSHAGAGADSSILLVLATTGIVGLLAFLNLWLKILQVGKNNWLFLAGLTGVFLHSFFNNTLFYPWIMEWLWIVLALGDQQKRIDKRN